MHKHKEDDPEDEASRTQGIRHSAVQEEIGPACQRRLRPTEEVKQGRPCHEPQEEEESAVFECFGHTSLSWLGLRNGFGRYDYIL